MINSESKELIGCCGLYCGLCSKYQSKAPSRCLGCKVGEQHSWCSIWNCCVKKHGFETCNTCKEVFSCEIFLRRKVTEWIPAADNLRQIKIIGLKNWLKEQKVKQTLLEELLQNYNDGRSMNLYCKSCARMSIDLINKVIKESIIKIKNEKIEESDRKSKANILKEEIHNSALKARINLNDK